MSRFKAIVAYDGHDYAGFQKQVNGTGIQSVIEKALEKIVRQPVSITASGRTDAGVHALGQVFHFDGPESIKETGYYNALNTLLPKDIRIRSVEKVDDDFHARFSARFKRYDYVLTRERDNPFLFHYKAFVWRDLDLEKMRQAAAILEGTHDFTSLSNAQIAPEKPRTKTIYSITVQEEGDDVRLVFIGNGFLRYQVRMMSAVLIAVGEGKLAADDVRRILEARDKHACRLNAPAKGLYLVQVGYKQSELDDLLKEYPPILQPGSADLSDARPEEPAKTA